MLDFLKPLYLYIRFEPNKIEVLNIETSENHVHYPQLEYGNERILIGDFLNAEIELRKAVSYFENKRIFKRNLIVVFQPLHPKIEKYYPVEIRVMVDALEHANAKIVRLYLGKNKLEQAFLKDKKNLERDMFIKNLDQL